MAAARARGTTVIMNAACEPHVQDLCHLLCKMGVGIEGIGSNVLVIEGADELHGCTHRVGPDHIEVASFIGLAAVTGGDLLIEDAAVEHLRAIRHSFRRLGVEIEIQTAPACACLPARSWWWSTTSTIRCPRSTTGRGRCSPPT